jgi:hypothetical protein
MGFTPRSSIGAHPEEIERLVASNERLVAAVAKLTEGLALPKAYRGKQ